MKDDEKIIHYQRGRKTIYFSDPKGLFHFVPNRNWRLYTVIRKTQPIIAELYDTIHDAKIGAIEFADSYWGRDKSFLRSLGYKKENPLPAINNDPMPSPQISFGREVKAK